VLRKFARTMAGSYDLTDALYDLSDSIVEVLGATAAGVALLDGDELRFVTATSDAGAASERAQERLQSGPCMASIEENRPVPISDIRHHRDRWPAYVPEAEEIGFLGVLGLPLVLGDRRVGSLDIYSERPRAWTDDQIDAALALADIAAAYVLNASELARHQRTAEQLQIALDSRIVIEQAKGMLAQRLGISPNDAFQRIRSSARRRSVTVAEVSRKVVTGDHVPD